MTTAARVVYEVRERSSEAKAARRPAPATIGARPETGPPSPAITVAGAMLIVALSGCAPATSRPDAAPDASADAQLQKCSALLEKVRLWCRERSAARRNESSLGGAGPGSFECLEARLELRRLCMNPGRI